MRETGDFKGGRRVLVVCQVRPHQKQDHVHILHSLIKWTLEVVSEAQIWFSGG